MLKAKNSLIGKISSKQNLIGKLNNPTVILEPELEDLTVTPTGDEQHFKSEKYGYDNVIVKAVESQEINITPAKEQQVEEGLFNKVTVLGDENLIPENIKEGTSIFGVVGTTKVSWDTTQIRQTYAMFSGNTTMTEAPFFDTSNVTSMSNMFVSCKSLIKVPTYNTQNVTNMSYMFQVCESLEEIPIFNTNKVQNMNGMFYNCKKLTKITEFDTSNTTNLSYAFYGCSKLKQLPLLDASKCIDVNSIVDTSLELENFLGLKDLGKAYTSKTTNYNNYKLNLPSKKLTYESLISIAQNLYDLNLTYNVNGGGTLYTQSLSLGSTNLAKLTEEEIAIATNKGWNVS